MRIKNNSAYQRAFLINFGQLYRIEFYDLVDIPVVKI